MSPGFGRRSPRWGRAHAAAALGLLLALGCDAATLHLPAAPASLAAMAAKSAGQNEDHAPLQVGFGRTVAHASSYEAVQAIAWSYSGGRWRGQLRIVVDTATGFRVGFSGLPDSLAVAFSASSGPKTIFGPGEAAAAARGGVFWGPALAGDTQDLEFSATERPPPGAIRIEAVSQLASVPTSAARGLTKSAGLCHEDVACAARRAPEFARAARSVAKILYTVGGATYQCTGTLVADGERAPSAAFLLTAKHCIGTAEAAASVNTFWFFESASCSGGEAPAGVHLARGARLAHLGQGDVALLQLRDPAPAGAEHTPLGEGTPAAQDAIVAIHHPRGEPKKFASGLVVDPRIGTSGLTAVAWLVGATEPGSSGSGLFSLAGDRYVLRGVLKGGSGSCVNSGSVAEPSNRDYYSPIDADRDAIRAVLGAAVLPDEDFTDMWASTDGAGHGLSVVQHRSGNVFALWATYDEASGTPTWLMIPGGRWQSGTRFAGELYRADRAGGRLGVEPVGSATITFEAGEATLELRRDGASRTVALRRQSY